jgi:threonylcarbamoyladenosine tRNA methylthiotransferase MtaB
LEEVGLKRAADKGCHTFRVITLGCKVNQYESDFFKESLLAAGLMEAPEGKAADIVIVNTCTVTASASHQSRQYIRRAVRENKGALVCAAGCYVQAFPKEVGSIEGIGLLVGNKKKKEIPELIIQGLGRRTFPRLVEAFSREEAFESMPVRRHPARTRAFLKIQDGCESYCSYCIVPYARGPSRSLPPTEVLSLLEAMAEEGVKEAVLTGIHLGRYGGDLSPRASLISLLDYLGKHRLPLRIRLSSLEPTELDSELIAFISSQDWICKHLHIPLQSGDSEILKKMNRHYSPEQFARITEDIRSSMPLAAIGVDVMSGFPGESAQAHENTVALIRSLPITYLHVFPYSARPGTAAAAMGPQLEQVVVRERTSRLRAIGREKRILFHSLCLGGKFEVLFEAPFKEDPAFMRGTSDNYLPVLCPRGSYTETRGFARVLAKSTRGAWIIARPICGPSPA